MTTDVILQDHLLFPEILWSRPQNMHKRQAGKILIVAGSRTMAGAALMVTEAAFRTGIGLIQLAFPQSLQPTIQPVLPESMGLPLAETPSGSIAAEAIPQLQEVIDDVDLLAIGPGLTRNSETQKVVQKLVADALVPVVVDADGLNAIADADEDPVRFFADRTHPTVLTPHATEMARLTGKKAQEIEDNRLEIAKTYAQDWNAILVLKGKETLIVDPAGRVARNRTGTPVLATAGTGDVLTGITATLIAQNPKQSFEAAATAVYLHGRAGEVAEKKIGQRGVMATDVIEALPEVFKSEENASR